MSEPAKIGALVRSGTETLSAAGVPDARRDVRLLLTSVLDRSPASLIGADRESVSEEEVAAFERLVARRASREPVSRILGTREFWSLPFIVTPAVLDPRPDSETLIEQALAAFPDKTAPLRVLDLGVGSGCLLLAFLSERPNATGIGVDRDEGAAEVARANAQALELAGRATVVVGNWADGLQEKFDVVFSNPPYIPSKDIERLEPEVREYDPLGALSGGEDGLAAYRALAECLPRLLARDGRAFIELGVGQVDSVRELMVEAGLSRPDVAADLSGIERCLVVRRQDAG